MLEGATDVAGLTIRSTDPVFLSLVGAHFLFGLTAVLSGALAMLSRKQRGRHTQFGLIYFWSIAVLFASATLLAVMRGLEDAHLVLLGCGAFTCAWIGRSARRGYWGNSVRIHLAGMGLSYVVMLTAFYVETGHQLPLWSRLPPILYWIIPSAVGLPLIAYALVRHPLVRGHKA